MTRNPAQQGVTLVELVVTLAIIGILAAIAVPNYQQYRLRVNRGDGKLCLAEIQRRQESYFLRRNSYTTDFAALALTATSTAYACGNDPVLYRITLAAPSGKSLSCCYQINAVAEGAQTKDGDLTLSYDSSERNPALQTIKTRKFGATTLEWD